jgi:hypothetical protein
MSAQRAVRILTTYRPFKRGWRLGIDVLGIVLLRVKAVFSDQPPASIVLHAAFSSWVLNPLHRLEQIPELCLDQLPIRDRENRAAARVVHTTRQICVILDSTAYMIPSLPVQPYGCLAMHTPFH